jgi:hypothetical protein
MAKPHAATVKRPNEPAAQFAGFGIMGAGLPAIPADCKGSSASRRYPHSAAMVRIWYPFSAGAASSTGIRYKNPTDVSGRTQSAQAISTTISPPIAQTVARCDSANTR